jgi:hypothetical protein
MHVTRPTDLPTKTFEIFFHIAGSSKKTDKAKWCGFADSEWFQRCLPFCASTRPENATIRVSLSVLQVFLPMPRRVETNARTVLVIFPSVVYEAGYESIKRSGYLTTHSMSLHALFAISAIQDTKPDETVSIFSRAVTS